MLEHRLPDYFAGVQQLYYDQLGGGAGLGYNSQEWQDTGVAWHINQFVKLETNFMGKKKVHINRHMKMASFHSLNGHQYIKC